MGCRRPRWRGWRSGITNEDTKYEIRDTNSEPSLLVSRISTLVSRMMALSVAYQQERPNVEAADLTGLVIRALGMIMGKLVKDEGELSELSEHSELYRKRYFILTSTIASAAQLLIQANELDIDIDRVTTIRIGRALTKMRLTNTRQPRTGKKGWMISLEDIVRWAGSYSLEPRAITGIDIVSHSTTFTEFTTFTTFTPAQSDRFEGIL